MFIQEVYQCIDCNYYDTSCCVFSECYFCNEVICNECKIENRTNICNNCNFNSNPVYFENNVLAIACSLCKTNIFLEHEEQTYCNKCSYIICNKCNYNSTDICVSCNENEFYSKLTNLNIN